MPIGDTESPFVFCIFHLFRVLLTGCSQPAALLSLNDNRAEWLITWNGYIAEPRHTRATIFAYKNRCDGANAV